MCFQAMTTPWERLIRAVGYWRTSATHAMAPSRRQHHDPAAPRHNKTPRANAQSARPCEAVVGDVVPGCHSGFRQPAGSADWHGKPDDWRPLERPRHVNAVYGCLEPETAMAEALANYRGYGIPVSEAMPLVFVAVSVELQAVIDFTDGGVTTDPRRDHESHAVDSVARVAGAGPGSGDAGIGTDRVGGTSGRDIWFRPARVGRARECRRVPWPETCGKFLANPAGERCFHASGGNNYPGVPDSSSWIIRRGGRLRRAR